ncbi:hypothetical protein GCM10009621_20490 [Corynebacterium felinum]
MSLASAVAIYLAVFANYLLVSSRASALLLALGVALGAATSVAMLRHPSDQKWARWISVCGGFVILLVGIVLASAKLSNATVLNALSIGAVSTAMPVAAAAALLGGLAQLPIRFLPWVTALVGGALLATWATLNDSLVHATVMSLVGAVPVSLAAAVACVFIMRAQDKTVAHVFAAGSSGVLSVVMAGLAATALTVLPPLPHALLWGVMSAAVLGVGAGLFYRPTHPTETPGL